MAVQLVPTPKTSEEFGRIEYELQIQLNAPRLVLGECYELTNPRMQTQFKYFCQDLKTQNIVDVFLSTTDLCQSVSDIRDNGIKFDTKNGFKFRVGSFEVNRNKTTIEVIRMQIALGNTLNFQKTVLDLPQVDDDGRIEVGKFIEDETPTIDDLATGYHSLRISKDNDFVVFNPDQIQTLNLVKFKGLENLDPYDEDEGLCDLCGKEKAAIWCINDSAKLCKDCDKSSHEINKIYQKHKRISLSEAHVMMEFCPIHPDEKAEYFCPVCQAPICIICKMNGSHSKGEESTHPLIPLGVAYAEAIDASLKVDENFMRKIEVLNRKIKTNEEKMSKILQNTEKVEEEINRLAQTAIEQARALAGEKTLLLRSAQAELYRKKDELKAHSSFLTLQKNSPEPLSFLKTFNRYKKMSPDLFRVDDLQPEVRVMPDLCVLGSLEVQCQTSNSFFNMTPVQSRTASPKSRSISPNTRSIRRRSADTSPKKITFTTITDLARKKEEKLQKQNIEVSFQPFQGSLILDEPSISYDLYLCLPIQPIAVPHLLFSTEIDGRSIQKMHQKIDNVGVTVILVKNQSTGYVFGGFAASKWNSRGVPFGDKTSSLLFSINQNAIIPFRPQIQDACYLYATKDTLTFGKYDLVLAGNFDSCSAVIENSYGVGLLKNSEDAKTFLAGEPNFVADIVEVWGLFTPKE